MRTPSVVHSTVLIIFSQKVGICGHLTRRLTEWQQLTPKLRLKTPSETQAANENQIQTGQMNIKLLTCSRCHDKVRTLSPEQQFRSSFKSVWVPRVDEENREAGENPARSRHCDERFRFFGELSKPGDLPRMLLQPF